MDYVRVRTLEEASSKLKDTPDSKVIAGGTDLLVHRRHKRIDPALVVDVKEIDILRGIKVEDDYLKIGACTTLNEIAEDQFIINHFSVLQQSAEYIGCYQIRNRATIGGNLCNASPAGDMIPALYSLEASVTYFANGQMHTRDINEFYTGPGKTTLPENAILCQINIPMKYKDAKGKFVRHSRRNSLDLSSISVCVVERDKKYRIAMGAVAPTVIRAIEAEDILNNKGLTEISIEEAADAAKKACHPISDLRASKEYRQEMIKSYTKKALNSLLEE